MNSRSKAVNYFEKKLVKQFRGDFMKMDKVAGSGNDEFYTCLLYTSDAADEL